ncbi:AMP-binding protein [Methylocystis heyeri]|uniref:AMP-binding protein n=1 Tax=Methylocystis heyeri TaxID=391905 RepID=UPI00113F4162|nr:AMP-binding protein [Methylocystis heyeri]
MTQDTGLPAKSHDLARTHPLTMFGIDALVFGSARLRPEKTALCDHGENGEETMAFSDLEKTARAFAARLGAFGLAPGARILLCCPAHGHSLAAITGIVAAGCEPVLAPALFSPNALAKAARTVAAEALIAPAQTGEHHISEILLNIAARAPGLRLLGSLSPEPAEGLVDFSPAGLLAAAVRPASPAPERWTLGDRLGSIDRDGAAAFVKQSALLGHGFDLVRETRHGGGAAPIVSLASPGTFAGLVAGPLAALLSGAELHFMAPFGAGAFLSLLRRVGPVRLVAPAAALPDLAQSGLLQNGALLSCAVVGSLEEGMPVQAPEDSCPILAISDAGGALTISALFEAEPAERVA